MILELTAIVLDLFDKCLLCDRRAQGKSTSSRELWSGLYQATISRPSPASTCARPYAAKQVSIGKQHQRTTIIQNH